MRSRSDIALGRPVGLWFFPRSARASTIGLSREVVDATFTADEQNSTSGTSGVSGTSGSSSSSGEPDPSVTRVETLRALFED